MKRMIEAGRKFGLDGFLASLLFVILLAYCFPGPGTKDSPYQLAPIATFGVSVIFFFYGLRLSPAKLRDGLSNWRLHLLIHSATFLIFPLIALLVRPFFGGDEMLWLGIFFLCILPSTVSSSVVMVGLAGGNLPAAIFNASISSLLGVFITPVWLGLVIRHTAIDLDLSSVILTLMVQVLLPVTLGMLLHGLLGKFAEKHKNRTRLFDQFTILLIVYTSFSESFAGELFSPFEILDLAGLAIGMCALFGSVYFLLIFLSGLLGFSRADKITATFCGSKKSLVQGAVMAQVLFAGVPEAGIILLPIMIYHSLQLIIVGILAQKHAAGQGKTIG